ncbi:DUF6174 domain-containing protein [Streptomyces sp. NPDC002309]
MKSARLGNRAVFAAVVVTGLMCATAACGSDTAPSATTSWEEPSSYTYTLHSSGGERELIGTFRVTVEDGEVTTAAGLDDSGRRLVRRSPDAVPTIRELLKEADQARQDGAHKAEVEYAADGHPKAITLDWEKNTVDDEAFYVISAYRADAR